MRAWLEHEEPHLSSTSQTRFLLLIASGVSLAAAIVAGWLGWPLASRVFALTTVATGGVHPVARAWRALRYSALDMNVLMTIAVVGAIAIGQWSEAATVVFLFAIAQHLESRSMDRARNAIRALMDLTPPDAAVVRNGTEMRVPLDAGRARRAPARASGREDPARWPRRCGRERRQPGADYRGVAAGGQAAGRRGVRRHHQRPRRHRDGSHAGWSATRRSRGSSTWSSPRRPSARPRRRSSIASRASTRPLSSRWRRWSRWFRRWSAGGRR